MKLLNKNISKDGSGHVTLRPEDDEDMWHVYNLVSKDDEVRALTFRKINTVSATGSTESRKQRIMLNIHVTKTEFSAGASSSTTTATGTETESTASLLITGTVTNENDFVRLGAYHTITIEAHREFRLTKQSGWDSVALERVAESTREGRGAEIGAIVCGEGTAALCLLSDNMTTVRQRIETSVPRKRKGGTSGHEKAMENFFSTVYQAILRVIPYQTLKVVIIASPGFTRDSLYDYIFQQASLTNNKPLLQSRSKWIKVHTATAHSNSLMEAVNAPETAKMLQGAKFARESVGLDRFNKMLGTDELRAWYGPQHVALAVDRGAVGTLLISDNFFRSSDPKTRNGYVEMVESVRARGGEVLTFSSMHESGKQLDRITGIAAILTYPLDVEIVEMEEKEEKERLAAEAAEGPLEVTDSEADTETEGEGA